MVIRAQRDGRGCILPAHPDHHKCFRSSEQYSYEGGAIIGGESTGKMPRTSWRLISTGRQSPDTDEDASLDMMDDGEWYGPLEQLE